MLPKPAKRKIKQVPGNELRSFRESLNVSIHVMLTSLKREISRQFDFKNSFLQLHLDYC